MTIVHASEAPGITPEDLDVDLVHWQRMPDREQALQFTPQGWALAEALAQFGAYQEPRHFIAHMLGEIINAVVDEDRSPDHASLRAECRIQTHGLTASVTFEMEMLESVAQTCGMELGELQIAIQASAQVALLRLYAEHSRRRRLH